MFAIAAEAAAGTSEDAIESLLDLAFGPGRFARSAYRLREGRQPVAALSFIAQDATGTLLGTIRHWPIRMGANHRGAQGKGAQQDALLLGPLAVHPLHQGEGIGLGLMQHSLNAAQGMEYAGVLLVGDAPYYQRAGFAPLPPGRVDFPGPVDANRILWRGFDGREAPAGRVCA